MGKMSAKNKIIILLIVWIMSGALMLGYFFKILDGQNLQTLNDMGQERLTLAVLQAEDQSFKEAQSDLQKLAREPKQPADFFSSDITLVKELVILENMQPKYGVQMTLSGVSGTINNLPSAPTASPIVVVPYSISLSGSLGQVVNFLEALENAPFVTDINGLSVSVGGQNSVNLNLAANFYLLK
ncbi:MAG: hypothetical protein P4L74_03500 [Candidatus Doudnabacteria bacterium]|nr:hypothetical protein [Candidatus Doudnabacteria bacterium]